MNLIGAAEIHFSAQKVPKYLVQTRRRGGGKIKNLDFCGNKMRLKFITLVNG